MTLSASEALLRMQQGHLSSSELLEQQLARVATFNPAINAVVVLDEARARQRAAEADAARRRGQSWGPLHGLPITVKESFDVTGLPTTWGYPELQSNIATSNATSVQRLIDAGAIVFGKTNVPVSLADWQTFNPVYGTTHNPWDLARVPGGSSGGSAAALAAGFTPLELGSDIGASIRNPAHYCGVYGHKPTWGVLPLQGHQLPGLSCADKLDIAVCGPMARTVTDLQLAMDVLAPSARGYGPQGAHPTLWRDDKRAVQELRIAIITDDPLAHVENVISQRLSALGEFLQTRVQKVGLKQRPVDSAESRSVYLHLVRAATGAFMDEATYEATRQIAAQLAADDQSYRACHYRGSTLSHRDWFAFDQRRAQLQSQWNRFFEDFDLLICPVATTVAFPHNQTGARWERMLDVDGTEQESTDAMFWAGYPGVVGLPATAIPLGHDAARNLPFGAQIVGPAFADPLTLRFAKWLEQEWYACRQPQLQATVNQGAP